MYNDLNSFLQEVDNETEQKGFEYAGEKFVLPRELPAKIVLRYFNKNIEGLSNEKQLEFVNDFLTSVFGVTDYDRLLDTGIGITKLMVLVQWVISQYQPQDKANEKENAANKTPRGRKTNPKG